MFMPSKGGVSFVDNRSRQFYCIAPCLWSLSFDHSLLTAHYLVNCNQDKLLRKLHADTQRVAHPATMQNTQPTQQPQPASLPPQSPPSSATLSLNTLKDPKAIFYILLAISLLSVILIISMFSSPATMRSGPDPFLFPTRQTQSVINPSDPTPPSIAYFISGSKGDTGRILRLLYATYHPRNRYLLHLDLLASQYERDDLALMVQSVPVFKAAENVDVIGKADFAYTKGSSPISSTLHGAAILLRLSSKWDWFISLNAMDYPLVTQDDLLHILSFLPKNLNFVNHSSYIGWKEIKKLKPIIVDPGLYLSDGTEMFYATQKRDLPTAYRIFTGSPFSILTRSVIEYCIVGTDNLPRSMLMYFSNTPSSLSNYFPTVLCNSRQFNRTIVNHNLLYAIFDHPLKDEPHLLTSNDFDSIIHSGAAFARSFKPDDPVLDRIDHEILNRIPKYVVPGGWCLGEAGNNSCTIWGDAVILRPGAGARRLEKTIVQSLSNGTFRSRQCKID